MFAWRSHYFRAPRTSQRPFCPLSLLPLSPFPGPLTLLCLLHRSAGKNQLLFLNFPIHSESSIFLKHNTNELLEKWILKRQTKHRLPIFYYQIGQKLNQPIKGLNASSCVRLSSLISGTVSDLPPPRHPPPWAGLCQP